MNESCSASLPTVTGSAEISIDWKYWARRLLVCSPFFLCSAALFLFAINRLSLDPNFLGDETANLLFNFSALQAYELVVVGTALLLARRRIWYDSALLVVIENGLALVPFLLISHAVVTTRPLGAIFAVIAVLFAGFRFAAIRRFYPSFHLPARALQLGAAILLFNGCLPFIFWPWVRPDMDRWIVPNQLLWLVVLPLVAAGANLLPKPTRYGGLEQERPWLPLLIHGLWTTGTAVHVWCIGYLCSTRFSMHQLGPVALVAAWTFWRRCEDCVLQPRSAQRAGLLGLTFIVPFLSVESPWLFEALLSCNLVAYAAVFRRGTSFTRILSRELMVVTVWLVIAAAPAELRPHWVGPLSHARFVAAVIGVAGCVYAARIRHPGVAVAAAATLFVTSNVVGLHIPALVVEHAPLTFLLLHSLSWRLKTPGLTALRVASAGILVLSALAVGAHADLSVKMAIAGEGALLVAAASVVRLVSGEWRAPTVPFCGGTLLLMSITDRMVREGSPGVLALVASGLLFALGAIIACTRRYWCHIDQEKGGGAAGMANVSAK